MRPGDFKGMKIFVTASGSAAQMQIMQALGYTPVPLDAADALIQLQTGGVDVVPTLPLMALAGQYSTVTKHMLDLNWSPLVGATVVTSTVVERRAPRRSAISSSRSPTRQALGFVLRAARKTIRP